MSPTVTISTTTATPLPKTERPAKRLRAVLAGNATTSLVTGIVAIAAARWVSDNFGISSTTWIRTVGAGLIVFALEVGLVARRGRARLRASALAISVADLSWVAATIAVLAAVDMTTTGRVVAVVLAVGVLDFALMQLWFRSRLAD